jgi:hypothetical protein
MHLLSKAEAIRFVEERDWLFDASPNPFSKSAWLLHFIEHVVEPQWRIIAPESFVGGVSTMLLCDDGRGVRALGNYYASLYSPLVTTGHHGAVRHLAAQLHRYPTINLQPLDAEEPSTAALEHALRDTGWYVRRYFAHGNWHMPCTGLSYADYLAGRESQVRNTIARKGKKFPGELRIVTSPADVDAAMDAYDAVYAKSWKVPEPYPGFVRGWARICAEKGWLRLGVATIDGAPIAAQFWFVIDGRASIFKLAYDEQHAQWSAGTLLTAQLMRHVLDVDRVSEVDYLTGDDPYKATWMTHRRERIGLMACNKRTVAGLARAAFEFTGALRQRFARSA